MHIIKEGAAADGPTRAHAMPFGAELGRDGGVRFRLWAPAQERVVLLLEGRRERMSVHDGWHELVTERAGAGVHYQFELGNGQRVPDPASRFQPEDVDGPSEVIDPRAYRWRDRGWRGRPWEEAVLYELHVGAFTPAGTFRAVIDKLEHLAALGVTAIELMPLADFPGRRNWGYDGVLPYAPDSSYGRPEDLKALVDAAHGHGLMVLLDVVYNHFGPQGNYLPLYSPQVFTERHHTPWGAAINYDGPDSAPVRELVIHNALYWLEEFHFDGLRLDAVHAILDDSPKHVLAELAERVRAAWGREREVHLLLENEENQAHFLARAGDGRPRLYTAQWNDDVHHGLHTAVTGETSGYYREYQEDRGKLARALAEGFAYQGEVMTYRGHARGEPSAHLPPPAFVAFLQNHDQVGNRAFGERITAIAPPQAARAAAAIYLLAPQVPMLFMGEEWAAAQPFTFFCDFAGDLANAVREGRRKEFARFPEFQDEAARRRIPDPTADETFETAKLRWEEATRARHADWLAWYRRILAVRREEIVPRLPAFAPGSEAAWETPGAGAGLHVAWRFGGGGRLTLVANLSDAPLAAGARRPGREIWREGAAVGDDALSPWSVVWRVDD